MQDFALQEAMLDKLGGSLMRPGALDNMKSIDYAHLFWACGLMHINPAMAPCWRCSRRHHSESL